MTDKQIINSCEFQSRCIQYKDMYSNKHIKCPIVDFAIACRGENKCKYKTVYEQLKRKEEECEKLKNERTVDFVKQLAQLKVENDGLKTMLKDLSYENQKFCYQIEEQTKQLEPFKDEYFKGLDNVAIAKLAKKSIRITAENSKLEQTLTEIKEICNSVENIENINSLYDAKLSGMYLQANKILQKISGCEI